MNNASLDILKHQIGELGLEFILGGLDTFLHREASAERPFTESLSELLDLEISQRKQRAAKTRLKISNIPAAKSLEDYDTEALEGITRKQLNELESLAFIERRENVVLMGPSGLGKSHILCALCRKACLEGYTAYHLTCQELMESLKKAKQLNRLSRKLKALCKPRLLAIDEIGYQNLTVEEAPLLFQLVAERYEKGSIIVTTNKNFGQWGELMGENAIATATLDRLLHHSLIYVLKGESYRLKNRMKLGLVPPRQ